MSKPRYNYQLETPSQLAALAGLEPTSLAREEFHHHIRMQLATIHKAGRERPKKGALEGT